MRCKSSRRQLAPWMWVACASLAVFPAGCFTLSRAKGGGMTRFDPPRIVNVRDIALPAGYTIEPFAVGMTFPTGMTFDDEGRLYVTESGYSYDQVYTEPRLLRVDPDGTWTVVASGENPPWTGAEYHEGAFYVLEGGARGTGRVVRITGDGEIQPMITGLPVGGDHFTGTPVFGPDGYLYFSIGTATNSGVVGEDNWDFGWPAWSPDFHDIPCEDIRVVGHNYVTVGNPATPGADYERIVTGAYVPFGTTTEPGQLIPGRVPCTGSVLRAKMPPADGERQEVGGIDPELVAWGFRNPYGLAFSPDGTLYATENGFDVRGSRPIFGAADHLWKVVPGLWYGFPDYAGEWRVDDNRFEPPGGRIPERLLLDHPNPPPVPAAYFGVHSSANGFDFSRNPAFGHVGEAFVAQFGDMAPGVGKVIAPVGYKVVRVDVETGVTRDFLVNKGLTNGPASFLGSGGIERPMDVVFDPTGTAMYVSDFGVMTIDEDPQPRPHTGVIWKITRAPGPPSPRLNGEDGDDEGEGS